MPTITTPGKTIACPAGANLRQVLLKQGINIHNGAAQAINCRGIGTCGTCAVRVEGKISPMEWREQARLSLPPHQKGRDRRLSCQVKVLGDVTVTKYDGFWGEKDQVAPEWL
jgi:ferredoxin